MQKFATKKTIASESWQNLEVEPKQNLVVEFRKLLCLIQQLNHGAHDKLQPDSLYVNQQIDMKQQNMQHLDKSLVPNMDLEYRPVTQGMLSSVNILLFLLNDFVLANFVVSLRENLRQFSTNVFFQYKFDYFCYFWENVD